MSDIICKRCNQMRSTSEFRPDSRYKRGFSSWCRECHRKRNREWAKKNRERLTKKSASWRRANPEKAREVWQAFHERNKKKRGEQNTDWSRRNRDTRRAASAKRKAAKLRATPKWVNWQKVRAIYSQAKRLQEFTGVPMHVDHIVPLQGKNVCGLHWEGNLQIIPASENCKKFNKWDEKIEEAYAQPDLFVAPPSTPPEQTGMDF